MKKDDSMGDIRGRRRIEESDIGEGEGWNEGEVREEDRRGKIIGERNMWDRNNIV